MISFAALFFEMVAIRWLASEIRLFAYLKNLPLIASFLGLGLGCALAGRPRLYFLFPALVAPFCLLVTFAVPLGLVHIPVPVMDEVRIWNSANWAGSAAGDAALPRFLVAVFGIFLVVVGMSVGLGERMGAYFLPLPRLTAYSANLLGSLAGIWAFSLISFLELPPIAWFSIGFAAIAPFVLRDLSPTLRALAIALLGVAMSSLLVGQTGALWSPYYRIQLQPIRDVDAGAVGTLLSVNHDYHQKALDLSDGAVADGSSALLATARFAYDLPYRFVSPRSVLVVGAGLGNDVAAALRHGAVRVDAVEIDPTILELGRRLHPERPYQDPRVTVVNDDARSVFKNAAPGYDLVVFGLLDAHTVLSSFSSVRLDSFVYTEESLREAVGLLAPGGVVAIGFSTNAEASDWLGWRLHHMLGEAIGSDPVAIRADYDVSTIFVAGPGVVDRATRDTELADRRLSWGVPPAAVEPATDDWPFLYLKWRGVPFMPYGAVLAGVLAMSVVLLRVSFRRATDGPDWHSFFLGAGFMLIEVRAITQLSLLFGSTWIVNAVVISAILMMGLAGNLFVAARRPSSPIVAYVLLGLAIIGEQALPRDLAVGLPLAARSMAGAAPVALPMLFAGIIFATAFARSHDPARAIGWNLLGAVVGGGLEYLSMAVGLSALGMLALGAYALSLVPLVQRRHPSVRTAPAP